MFGVDLVRDIVSPLPTRRAIKMMNSCLGDREKGLWQALGDYWLHPRCVSPINKNELVNLIDLKLTNL